jgi:hypothetical protein
MSILNSIYLDEFTVNSFQIITTPCIQLKIAASFEYLVYRFYFTFHLKRSHDCHPVYSTAFIVIIQGIFEGFVAYVFLVFGWGLGDSSLSLKASGPFGAFSALQPLFDSLRKLDPNQPKATCY